MSASAIEAPGKLNIEFNKLWIGESISMIGTQVTLLALPITAAVTLGASSMQMGFLNALESLPALLFGLLAGAWIDRHRRRPVLIAADMGRACMLAIIPLAAVLGILRVEVLYGVAFFAGGMAILFNIAYRSYLPHLVGREQLVQANSRLELSNSIADILGPGLAGGLIQVLGAPIAILADVFSYIVSALSIGSIHKPEQVVIPGDKGQNLWVEIKDGLRLVFGERRLRAIAGCITFLSLFNSVFETIQILFLTRQVGLSAGWLGIIFASGSAGLLLGAVSAGRVTRSFGIGRSMVVAVSAMGISDLFTPLAGSLHGQWLIVGILVLAQFIFGFGLTIFQVGQISLRQTLTPDDLQGRMNATMSTLSWGIPTVGGLIGGGLGQVLGLSLTLVLASVGEVLAILWLVFSPVWMMRQASTG